MTTSFESSTPSLYHYPHLYEQLRPPCPVLLDAVVRLVRALPEPPLSLYDPACGSGSWLEAVARRTGLVPFGADSAPEMVEAARTRLRPLGGEAYLADAREFEAHRDAFDVAIELSGFACMLAEGEDRLVFLERLAAQVRPGGVVVLLVHFPPAQATPLPRREWEEAVRLGDAWGEGLGVETGAEADALIEYDVVAFDEARETEWVRRTVTTRGRGDLPPRIVDEYPIRLWSEATVCDVARRVPELELVAAAHPDAGELSIGRVEPLEGDRVVVFRRRGAAISSASRGGA